MNSVFFISFDTEALNKILHHIPDDITFENTFTNQSHQKVCYGTQQLYILGQYIIL